jgi:hypothetical protein
MSGERLRGQEGPSMPSCQLKAKTTRGRFFEGRGEREGGLPCMKSTLQKNRLRGKIGHAWDVPGQSRPVQCHNTQLKHPYMCNDSTLTFNLP